jgi:hypothetical protein
LAETHIDDVPCLALANLFLYNVIKSRRHIQNTNISAITAAQSQIGESGMKPQKGEGKLHTNFIFI